MPAAEGRLACTAAAAASGKDRRSCASVGGVGVGEAGQRRRRAGDGAELLAGLQGRHRLPDALRLRGLAGKLRRLLLGRAEPLFERREPAADIGFGALGGLRGGGDGGEFLLQRPEIGRRRRLALLQRGDARLQRRQIDRGCRLALLQRGDAGLQRLQIDRRRRRRGRALQQAGDLLRQRVDPALQRGDAARVGAAGVRGIAVGEPLLAVPQPGDGAEQHQEQQRRQQRQRRPAAARRGRRRRGRGLGRRLRLRGMAAVGR